MKNTIWILLFFFISSCNLLKTNTIKTLDVSSIGVIQLPTVAELSVKETKVTGTAISNKSTLIEATKKAAIADALLKSGADILVEPSFETVQSFTTITVNVSGYPAKYKNFRTVTTEDIPLLQAGVYKKVDSAEPQKIEKKKNNRTIYFITGIIFFSVTVLSLLII